MEKFHRIYYWWNDIFSDLTYLRMTARLTRETDEQEYVDNTLTFSSRLFRSGNWNKDIRIRLVNNVAAVWKMINVSSSEILV